MAKNFKEWLETGILKHKDCLRDEITVVGLIGKETTQFRISKIVNHKLFHRVVFKEHNNSTPSTSIDSFYDSKTFTLYLLFNGLYNPDVQTELFGREKYAGKTFFEKMAILEMENVHYIHLMFVICHYIVFFEPINRVDPGWIRILKIVKSLRQKAQNYVKSVLKKKTGNEMSSVGGNKNWYTEGRLALPSLLFVFTKSTIRSSSFVKRKEFSERMEKALENQLVTLLKHHRIVDNSSPYSSLASFLPIPQPFAYIFSSFEQLENDSTEKFVNEFCNPTSKAPFGTEEFFHELIIKAENECSNKSEFEIFLKNSLDEDSYCYDLPDYSSPFYEFPKLKDFIENAKLVFEVLITQRNFDFQEASQKINSELQIVLTATNDIIKSAITVYEQSINSSSIKTSQMVSKGKHEEKLEKASTWLKTNLIGNEERLMDMLTRLRNECTKIWEEGHQQCEILSLTGNYCRLSNHDSKTPHCSKITILSTCNCGENQTLRLDPFSLKEANCDFYQFDCCYAYKSHEFCVSDSRKIRSSSKIEGVVGSSSEPFKSVFEMTNAKESVIEDDDPNGLNRSESSVEENALEILKRQAKMGGILNDETKDNVCWSSDSEYVADSDEDYDDDDEEEEVEEYLMEVEKNNKKTNEHATELSSERILSQMNIADNESLESMDDVNLSSKEVEQVPYYFCGVSTQSNFSSWSLLRIGPFSSYNPLMGLRHHPNFKSGSEYLLPWFVNLTTTHKAGENLSIKLKNNKIHREKIKLYIGFEYECPRGHRFMIQSYAKPYRRFRDNDDLLSMDAEKLFNTDLAVWMSCTCKREPRMTAQLARFHIVIPNAPINVLLSPKVDAFSHKYKDRINGYFHFGEEQSVQLERDSYYILRFPFIYLTNGDLAIAPSWPQTAGKLLRNCIKIINSQ